MKFGPKFQKLFVAYPDIDKTIICHNTISTLTRSEMYNILKSMKKAGVNTPAQPTRTQSWELRQIIWNEMNKLTK